MSRWGNPTALPAAEALAVKKENIRTVRLRLLPTSEQERELKRLGDLCARMWNELNYERMQLFKEGKLTREAMRETQKKYYEKYRGVLGSGTAAQIASMNNEAWASYFAMLKAKKEGRLPPFIERVSPLATGRIESWGRGSREYLYSITGMLLSLSMLAKAI